MSQAKSNAAKKRLLRQVVFAGLTVILSAALIELGARVLLAANAGAFPSADARARERADTARDPTEAVVLEGDAETDRDTAHANALRRRGIVIHPFFGYVRDPAAPRSAWSVGADGFYVDDRPAPPRDNDDEPFRVAMLGGSFANQFAFAGETTLVSGIGRAVGRPSADILIRSLAMGGYKQPQQLHILADRLAHGEHFDLVLNVDGFNEVALPFGNLASGLAPAYPANWQHMVGGLPDVDTALLAGEIAFLRERRRQRAGLCRGWRRRSAVCHLLWRATDRPLAARLADLERTLALPPGETRRFEVFGPEPAKLDREARTDAAVALWRRASLAADALARRFGIPYVHILQPNQYLPGAKVLHPDERATAFDPKAPHQPLVETGYPKMRAAGAQLVAEGVRFIDMSLAFAETPEPVFADRCCHLTGHGYRRFGAMVGDRLRVTDLSKAHAPSSPARRVQ